MPWRQLAIHHAGGCFKGGGRGRRIGKQACLAVEPGRDRRWSNGWPDKRITKWFKPPEQASAREVSERLGRDIKAGLMWL